MALEDEIVLDAQKWNGALPTALKARMAAEKDMCRKMSRVRNQTGFYLLRIYTGVTTVSVYINTHSVQDPGLNEKVPRSHHYESQR